MATFWLPLLVFAAIFGGISWLNRWQAQQARANLAVLAGRQGLEFTEEKKWIATARYQLRGSLAGRPLRFWNYSTGSGRSQVSWIAVVVQARGGGDLTAEFRRRGFTTRVMALFRARAVTFDDAAFDAAWFVQCNRPEFLRAALVPAIREKFAGAAPTGTGGNFKLQRGEAGYAEQGGFHNRAQCERLERQLPLLQDLADLTEMSADAPAGG